MAGWQDFTEFKEDFAGSLVFAGAGSTAPWRTAVTGAAPPTAAVVSPSNGGEVLISMTSADQTQVVCIDLNDVLCFDIDQLLSAEFRVKCSADFAATTSLGFGLQSARNADLDATTVHAQFRLKGNNNVLVETDDNVRDISEIATGKTLSTVYKRFYIDFAGGKANVKFYVDGERVAAGQVFDMSASTGSLQPFIQLQKTSTATGTATIDYLAIRAKRY